MKRFYNLMTMFLLAVMAAVAQDAEETVFDLTVRDNFDKCTQSSETYDRSDVNAWSFNTYRNYITMYDYNITNGYYDDKLTTPDLDLETGKMYVVYLQPSAYMPSDADKSNITVSLESDEQAVSRELAKIEKLPYENNSSPAPLHEVTFVVEQSGKYRVSFNAGPYSIYLKNTQIKSRGASEIPKAPSDFTVAADPDGALSVSVSFTMPSTTITGQPLESPKYNLYRGFQKIKNGVQAACGERVEITEARGETGIVSYSVEIICGEAVSDKLTVESYVGPETPLAPSDANLALEGSLCKVSWKAPVTGEHGVALLPEKLTYTVTRVLDGVETVVASDIAALTYEEDVVPSGLQTLSYKVYAKYGPAAKQSGSVSTQSFRIGTASLPFADSFSGAELSPLWENEIVTGASYPRYYWQAKDKMDLRTLACEPYDADGGLLLYDSYNIQKNNSARLSTPPLAFTEGDNVVLSFAMFHIAQGTDVMKVQVSSDFGEWVDVPEAVFTPKGEPAGEWSVHTVQLSPSIAAGTTSFRVGLLGDSQYGQSVVIDDLRIFRLAEKDLSVSSVEVPADINAGKTATLVVKIDNNSASEIPASDYSVEIISDFPQELTIGELRDIPAISSVMYNIELPVTSGHLVEKSDFSFAARVECTGDTETDNDLSATSTMSVGYSAGTPASDLTRTGGENGEHFVSWTPAKDLAYVPVSLVESFEDESLAETPTGPFNGWTQVDLDGASGGVWYSASGPQFNFIQNANVPTGLDGKNCLGVTVESNKQQNDWLISPVINCKEGSTMNLSMLMGVKQVTSYGNEYEVTLKYCTGEEFDILNPQDSFVESVASIKSTSTSDRILPQDNKMHELTFEGIPAEARRIALHFTSKGKYTPAMWVDNIRIIENDPCPLVGYRIYSVNDGLCLSDELIGADETTYTLRSVARDSESSLGNVFVSAVYPDGEAEPSNYLDLTTNTGVDIMECEDVVGDRAEYYDLNGLRVDVRRVDAGVYVRRTGGKTEKILVR